MSNYHLRRKEKEIVDPTELTAIVQQQKYLTLAMCKDNEPYLASLSYGYDPESSCFYFHCAGEGKKIDFLRAQPIVWGQIVEDNGYLYGACDHAFRTVQFRGRVVFVDDLAEKRHALQIMIEGLERDPEPVKTRLMKPERIEQVTIGKIIVEAWSGKQSPRPS